MMKSCIALGLAIQMTLEREKAYQSALSEALQKGYVILKKGRLSWMQQRRW